MTSTGQKAREGGEGGRKGDIQRSRLTPIYDGKHLVEREEGLFGLGLGQGKALQPLPLWGGSGGAAFCVRGVCVGRRMGGGSSDAHLHETDRDNAFHTGPPIPTDGRS